MIKKIPVDRLSIGMYLCGNDRKWLETPFFRRKFLLKTEHQIAELQQYCKFVLIDTDKGADISEAQLPEMINDIQGCNHKCDYGVYPVGSIIVLDNGQMAIVVKANLDINRLKSYRRTLTQNPWHTQYPLTGKSF